VARPGATPGLAARPSQAGAGGGAPVSGRGQGATAAALLAGGLGANDLRRAIIIKEILNPPLAMRSQQQQPG
jgi:hypothetical protein